MSAINLLLGSYSQGLLVQRSQLNRAHPAALRLDGEETETGQVNATSQTRGLESILSASVEPVQAEERRGSEDVIESRKSVLERFSENVSERLKSSAEQDPVAASVKAERLARVASEIGGALGKAKANEFMSKILIAASSDGGDDGSVELQIESFFSQTAEAAKNNPRAYQELEKARKELNDLFGPENGQSGRSGSSPASLANPANDSPQARLFQSYVSARQNYRQFQPTLSNSSGNLISVAA
jgi:hypothetical protein